MNHIIKCDGVWKRYIQPPRGIKDLLVGKIFFSEDNYSRDWVLQNISFKIKKGISMGIVGSNGTGKSTLLSLLLGTIRPDRGKISCTASIGSLLELGAGFHPELTGKQNIYLYASILGLTLYEIKQKIASIIEFSELANAIENPIRTYSSGMIARLGFSVVIHTHSDILLIDEVLAVGDTRFQKKCLEYLSQFKKQNGTLIIVSHEMQVLKDICEVGICINMGKVYYQGSMDKVIHSYNQLLEAKDL